MWSTACGFLKSSFLIPLYLFGPALKKLAFIASSLFGLVPFKIIYIFIGFNNPILLRMRLLVLSVLLVCSTGNVFCNVADTCCIATLSDTIPAAFLKLRLSNDTIAKNDVLNEEIVDMIRVRERDEKVPTWYTTHQGGTFGWFIRMIGFWWQAVDRHRYKFVGTNRNNLNMPGEKDELTEHDVNFNIIPHLPQYLNFVYRGRQEQVKHKYNFKRDRDANTSQPPYVPPTLQTAAVYDLHCELTPPKRMRDSVDFLFYPCNHGSNLDKHPNFCDAKPTVGLYGVFVLDCNHSCHPEIHPYEWLWWLSVTEEERTNNNFNKEWMLGFFRESSNRFILWSQRPRVGTIAIPFIFKTDETNSYLKLNHVVTGKFLPRGIKRIKGVPANTTRLNFTDTTLTIQLGNNKTFPLRLLTNRVINTPALRYWLSDVHTDADNKWVWGYFNLLVSVRDGYTARLESVTKK